MIRYWAGAVEYHHDELGLGDFNIDGVQATFNNHAQETKAEMQFLPMRTPLGALISTVGAQFDHQQIDTAGDAGSLLGSARTNRGAGYFINELWFTDRCARCWRAASKTSASTARPASSRRLWCRRRTIRRCHCSRSASRPQASAFKVLKDLPSWMVASATVQSIERAPTALELFAHGSHDAPGTFDIGNPGPEDRNRQHRRDRSQAHRRHVPLRRQGLLYLLQQFHLPAGDRHPVRRLVLDLRRRRHRIHPDHLFPARRDLPRHRARLAVGPVPVATGIFGVDGQYDFVRATFTDGSNVPRMPPMRVGGGTYWRNDNWFVRMGLLHAFAQNDLGVNDTPTAGYNLLKMEISNKRYWRDLPWGPTEITTGLVGDNLLDVDVRNSVQFHKDEILLPGRSIKFFMNAKFGGDRRPASTDRQLQRADRLRRAVLQGAGRDRLELGRSLYRRQHRIQRGQIQDRRGVQRCDAPAPRCSPPALRTVSTA